MAITLVGGLINPNSSSGVASFTFAPVNVGDVFPFLVHVFGVTTPAVQAITCTNSKWYFGCRIADPTFNSTLEIWYAVSTSTSSATATITWNPANGVNFTELAGAEYTNGMGAGSTWTTVAAQASVATTNTTMTGPSLTPTGAAQMAFTAWDPAQTASVGSTSGFTYTTSAAGEILAWDLALTSGTAVQATASQTPTGTYQTAGVILQASPNPAVIISSSGTQTAPMRASFR